MYNHLPVTSVFKTTQIHIYAVSLTLFLCSRELSRSDSCACGVRDLNATSQRYLLPKACTGKPNIANFYTGPTVTCLKS